MGHQSITLFPFTGQGEPIKLGSLTDPMRDGVMGIERGAENLLQLFNATGAARTEVFDRLTKTHSFAINVIKDHGTPGDALVYIATHPDEVPGKVNLEWERDNRTVYAYGVGVANVRLVRDGNVFSIFRYELTGGRWTTSPINS